MNDLAENQRFESGISYQEDGLKDIEDVMDRVLRSGTNKSYAFLNEGRLREQLRIFQEHFLPDDPERRILYAIKANPRSDVLSVLKEAGIDGFDCASGGEIERVLSIPGVKGSDVYYNNPVKNPDDVFSALSRGVQYYTVDHQEGLDAIAEKSVHFKSTVPEVAVRVGLDNPDARINLPDKFGCSPHEALALMREIELLRMRASLAMNVGSQNRNPHAITKGIKLLSEITRKFGKVPSINLGGGFPVNYFAEDHFNLREFLTIATQAVQTFRADIMSTVDEERRIMVEPGRALVAPAVDLAIPILGVKRNGKKGLNSLTMDSGVFGCFSDAAFHKWQYNMDVFTRDGRELSGEFKRFVVWGSSCDSKDVLDCEADNVEYWFPSDVKRGDFLWIRNAGAYMDSQHSQFHLRKPPEYVKYNNK